MGATSFSVPGPASHDYMMQRVCRTLAVSHPKSTFVFKSIVLNNRSILCGSRPVLESRSQVMVASLPTLFSHQHNDDCRQALRHERMIHDPSEPDLDTASSARNIAGWKPDPGEHPPNFPEKYWRTLAVSQVDDIEMTRMSKDIDSFRKRIAWSCKNRGWAEMGKLLDDFFSAHKDGLGIDDLRLLHRILLGTVAAQLHRLSLIVSHFCVTSILCAIFCACDCGACDPAFLAADDMFLMALVCGKKPVPPEFDGPAMHKLIAFAARDAAAGRT
jgi:succinate dehydrogenase flavin-adding protein (antitoxin of CptAB toxin-antitoxin module)